MKTSDEMKVEKEFLEENENELNKDFLKILYRFIPKVEALEKALKFLYNYIVSTFDCNDCVHVVSIDGGEDTGCDINLCIDPKDCEEFIYCEDSDNNFRKAKELYKL